MKYLHQDRKETDNRRISKTKNLQKRKTYNKMIS